MSSTQFEPLSPVEPADDIPDGLWGAILAAHRGKYGLGQTYWLWFALPMAVWRGAVKLLDLTSLSLLLENKYLYYGLFGAVELGQLIWLYYFGIGIFRSATRATSAFWATLACIIVGISFFVSPVIVFMNGLELAGIGSGLVSPQEQAETLNLQLPRRIDASTILQHVDYANGRMTFLYQVTAASPEMLDWDNQDRLLIWDDCSRHEAQFRSGALKSVAFRYQTPSGQVLHQMVLNGPGCTAEARARSGPPLTGEKLLEEQYGAANKNLPQRLDRITTLSHIVYANHVLQYQYQVDTNAVNPALLQRKVTTEACQKFKQRLVSGEFTRIEYRYVFPGKAAQTVAVEKSDCP